jgi:hypothetical protein
MLTYTNNFGAAAVLSGEKAMIAAKIIIMIAKRFISGVSGKFILKNNKSAVYGRF